jgi:hypothetical protein
MSLHAKDIRSTVVTGVEGVQQVHRVWAPARNATGMSPIFMANGWSHPPGKRQVNRNTLQNDPPATRAVASDQRRRDHPVQPRGRAHPALPLPGQHDPHPAGHAV